MLTTGQVHQRRRFTPSPSGGFAAREVDAFVDRVLVTLDSYERTGTPDTGGLTADGTLRVTFRSAVAEPGYGFLVVQDFLDSVHETLAILESRVAHPPQAMSLARAATVPAAGTTPTGAPTPTTWTPQGTETALTAVMPAVAPHPHADRRSDTHDTHDAYDAYDAYGTVDHGPDVRRVPTNLTSAVGVLSRVAAQARAGHAPAPMAPAPVPAATSWSFAAPAPPPAPSAPVERGMDVDALIFELQRAAAQSRSRGALRVEVQTPDGRAPVLRVVEATPGTITIIAQ